MTLLALSLSLACSCGRACHGETPALSSPPATPAPVEAPTAALPDLRDHLASGAPEPRTVLDLNTALWGASVPNSLKGIDVAWDPSTGLLYTQGIASSWLLYTDPEDGHPKGGIDLSFDDNHTSYMAVDDARRRLWWVTGTTEAIRVVDLDAKAVVARTEGERSERHYPVMGIALDPSSGWLWVVNTDPQRVRGYSPDLSQTVDVEGLWGPIGIAADPKGDRLLIADSESKEAGRLVVYTPSTGELTVHSDFGRGRRPPRIVIVGPGSEPVVIATGAMGLHPDGSPAWRGPRLPDSGVAAAVSGNVLATVMREPGRERGRMESAVSLVDASSGTDLGTVEVRYEARRIAADPQNGRFFIGNGGDGSVSIVDATSARVTKTLDVANGAEGLVIDPKTGTRYVLNRLGGSVIYAWKADGSLAELAGAPWPFELAIDLQTRQLIAATHYDGALHRWDLDGGQELPALDLQIPASTGDAIGDLDYVGGLAAVVLPESGWVSLVDVAEGTVRWTHEFREQAAGVEAGPGKGLVELGRDRVYVAIGKPAVVYALALDDGRVLAEQPAPRPPRDAYKLNALFYDDAGRRLFLMDSVLDPESLVRTGGIEGSKVLYADAERVLAMGLSGPVETLYDLEPGSLAVRGSWPLTTSNVMHTEASWDPSSGLLYLSDLRRARVTAWKLP